MKKLATLVSVLLVLAIGLVVVGPAAVADAESLPLIICKTKCGPDRVPVGVRSVWDLTIKVQNTTGALIEGVVVKDRLGAELEVVGCTPTKGALDINTKGASDKVFLTWDVGDLTAGEEAWLYCTVATDLNPAGKQEYTSCGYYCLNSGAVAKGMLGGKQVTDTSDTICGIEAYYPD